MQQHRKLVLAGARDQIRRADATPQDRSDFPQHPVPGRCAMPLVEFGEAIEIEHAQRMQARQVLIAWQAFELSFEGGARGERRQAVVRGAPVQQVRFFAPRGHIAQQEYQPVDAAIRVAYRRHHAFDAIDESVIPPQAGERRAALRDAGGKTLFDQVGRQLVRARRRELQHGLHGAAQRGPETHASQAFGHPVHIADAAITVEPQQAFGHRGEGRQRMPRLVQGLRECGHAAADGSRIGIVDRHGEAARHGGCMQIDNVRAQTPCLRGQPLLTVREHGEQRQHRAEPDRREQRFARRQQRQRRDEKAAQQRSPGGGGMGDQRHRGGDCRRTGQQRHQHLGQRQAGSYHRRTNAPHEAQHGGQALRQAGAGDGLRGCEPAHQAACAEQVQAQAGEPAKQQRRGLTGPCREDDEQGADGVER